MSVLSSLWTDSLTVRIIGGFPERFFNLCAREGIAVSEIRTTACGVQADISVRDFKKIRPAAVESGIRLKVIKKNGALFVVRRYRKRTLFLAGAVLFLLLILTFSSFVWTVSVEGNVKIAENEIKTLLASCDFKPGVLKYKRKISEIQEACLKKEPRLLWLWIEFKGTRAIVKVREYEDKAPAIPPELPCDVVARRDGILTSVLCKSGKAVVSEGETVTGGQLLISRVTDAGRITHADGIAMARTWYTVSARIPLSRPQYRLMEGTFTKQYVRFGRYILPLSWKSSPFEHARADFSSERLCLFGSLPLPLFVITCTERELSVKDKTFSASESAATLQTLLYHTLQRQLPLGAQITDCGIKSVLLPNTVLEVTLTAECLEDIALPCP